MKLGFEAELFLEPRDPSPSDKKQELGDFMDSLIANIMQKEPGTRKVVNDIEGNQSTTTKKWCLTEDVTIRDEVWDAAKPPTCAFELLEIGFARWEADKVWDKPSDD
jgi:hypothetical protein